MQLMLLSSCAHDPVLVLVSIQSPWPWLKPRLLSLFGLLFSGVPRSSPAYPGLTSGFPPTATSGTPLPLPLFFLPWLHAPLEPWQQQCLAASALLAQAVAGLAAAAARAVLGRGLTRHRGLRGDPRTPSTTTSPPTSAPRSSSSLRPRGAASTPLRTRARRVLDLRLSPRRTSAPSSTPAWLADSAVSPGPPTARDSSRGLSGPLRRGLELLPLGPGLGRPRAASGSSGGGAHGPRLQAELGRQRPRELRLLLAFPLRDRGCASGRGTRAYPRSHPDQRRVRRQPHQELRHSLPRITSGGASLEASTLDLAAAISTYGLSEVWQAVQTLPTNCQAAASDQLPGRLSADA